MKEGLTHTNMAVPDVTSIIGNFSHVGTDILVFVFTEIIVRLVFSGNTGRSSHIKTLFTQGVILAVVAVLLAVFHHKPYILGLLLFCVFVRFIGLVYGAQPDNDNVSRPLRYTPEIEDLDAFENTPELYGNQPQRYTAVQPKPLVVTTNHNLHEQWPQTRSSSIPFTRRTSSTVTQRRAGSLDYPGEKRTTSGSLQRPPMTSPSMSPPNSTRHQAPQFSLFCHQPSFGYFSALLDSRKPSITPPGIINAGNTCFVNSIIQCLTWTPGFTDTLPLVSLGSRSSSVLIRSLNNILSKCHVFPDGQNTFNPVDASELLNALSLMAPHLVVPYESGHFQSQQDASEFLLWLLDSIHDFLRQRNLARPLTAEDITLLSEKKHACLFELEKANSDDIPSFRDVLTTLSDLDWHLNWHKNSSSIYNLFLGQLVEARECQHCRKMSMNVEYFTVLPIPVPPLGMTQSYDLEGCFNLFSEVEELVKTNMLQCSCALSHQGTTSSLTPGKRLALLSKPPKALVLQLTRFSYDSARKIAIKNAVSITFPLLFNLHPFTMEAKLSADTQRSMPYQLYAFCAHTGAQSTTHGHYIAYCKAGNGTWYRFNDKNVNRIVDIEREVTSIFVLQNAYLLFYALQQ